MIGYLHGKITFLASDYCFLDVGGVGYRVFITSVTRSRLKINDVVKLYTHFCVREDAMLLYGFIDPLEYEIFCRLISVSKIGPKAGLGLLSALSCEKLVWAVQNRQTTLLTNAPGIGKKTAERIVLELKDKLADVKINVTEEIAVPTVLPELAQESGTLDNYGEAAEALAAFGYTKAEINSALKKADKNLSTEAIIKFALRELSL